MLLFLSAHICSPNSARGVPQIVSEQLGGVSEQALHVKALTRLQAITTNDIYISTSSAVSERSQVIELIQWEGSVVAHDVANFLCVSACTLVVASTP